MPASATPLPITAASLRAQFAGVEEALLAIAEAAHPTLSIDNAVTLVLERAIRAAQYKLQELTGIPYFVTRYSTRELAAQNELLLGTDFDEVVLPQNYRRDVFWRQTGRTTLQWHPVKDIQQYALTLENQAVMANLELEWLQLNNKKGVVHLVPWGLNFANMSFMPWFIAGPYARGAGQIPLFVHTRYRAGLVERTGSYDAPDDPLVPYDPEAYPKNTWFRQELCESYCTYIGRLGAALLCPAIGAYISHGGATISVPGISETINPQEMLQRADTYQKEAAAWAKEVSDLTRGPVYAML